jgi:hypothetical protein
MMEWGPAATPDQQIDLMLSQELAVGELIGLSPCTPPLSDDRPVNEYDLLRHPRVRKMMARTGLERETRCL